MNNTKKMLSTSAMKAKIQKVSVNFEKRLSESKNSFERVIVYNDIEELIEAEIFKWLDMVDASKLDSDNADKLDYTEIDNQIASLQAFIKTVQKYRAQEMPGALAIQAAMLRQHKLTKPLIIND